jgi:acetylornithine deacetylase/succinyl-diaminopimelate desuccinylase-like protein
MSTAVVCRLAAERERAPLARDVIFAAVADEETGCALGSRFLVEEHAEEVEAEYMLGEVGGFSQYFGDAQVFPVQVATKGLLWMRASAVGTSGHGSIPSDDNPVVHLARALARLGSVRLPQHLTPVTREFITRVARLQPPVKRAILRLLLRPRFSPFILDRLFPDRTMARSIDAGLRNTVNPTQLEAGLAPNVIPTTASAVLDGRYLPGQTPADLIAEIRRVVGDQIAIEVMTELPAQETHPIDSPLLESIEAVIGERFPQAKVVPYLCPGFTDAAYFARLGARAYGFTPVLFEPQHDIRFADLFHGVDERIPVDGFRWGVEVLYDVIRHFAAGR